MNENIKTPTSATPVSCDVSSSIAARYGAAEANVPLAWNDTIELLLSHRSVRGFLSDPLPTGTLEALIAAAQSASSSSNVQRSTLISSVRLPTCCSLRRCVRNGVLPPQEWALCSKDSMNSDRTFPQ